MNQVDRIQKQIGDVSRDMKTLRKNWKEKLDIKNTMLEVNSAFDGLISRLDMDEETISELEDTSAEFWKTEKQGEQRLKK